MANKINLVNKQFGQLTVLNFHKIINNHYYWECECSCKNIRYVTQSALTHNETTSCRPCTIERLKSRKPRLSHGCCPKSGASSEYKSYMSAKARCENPNNIGYKTYGGKGIKFQLPPFEEFIKIVGLKPNPSYTLDRINNNENYTIENVRWATKSQQSRNRNDRKKYQTRGKSLLLCEWSIISSIPIKTIHNRIYNNNWCIDCAIFLPKRHSCPHRQ